MSLLFLKNVQKFIHNICNAMSKRSVGRIHELAKYDFDDYNTWVTLAEHDVFTEGPVSREDGICTSQAQSVHIAGNLLGVE